MRERSPYGEDRGCTPRSLLCICEFGLLFQRSAKALLSFSLDHPPRFLPSTSADGGSGLNGRTLDWTKNVALCFISHHIAYEFQKVLDLLYAKGIASGADLTPRAVSVVRGVDQHQVYVVVQSSTRF